MCHYKNDEGSPRTLIGFLFVIAVFVFCVFLLVLQGCALRLSVNFETDEAVYGKSSASRALSGKDIPVEETDLPVNK